VAYRSGCTRSRACGTSNYGEREVEDHVSREDAESAADAAATAEQRTVVVEE
jgi:hypothetical protein